MLGGGGWLSPPVPPPTLPAAGVVPNSVSKATRDCGVAVWTASIGDAAAPAPAATESGRRGRAGEEWDLLVGATDDGTMGAHVDAVSPLCPPVGGGVSGSGRGGNDCGDVARTLADLAAALTPPAKELGAAVAAVAAATAATFLGDEPAGGGGSGAVGNCSDGGRDGGGGDGDGDGGGTPLRLVVALAQAAATACLPPAAACLLLLCLH